MHFDATGGGLGADLEARVVEDVEHRPVVCKRRGLKAGEAVGGAVGRQALEEQRREALAVEALIDGERDFGDQLRDSGV